jgi:hypothetical protein
VGETHGIQQLASGACPATFTNNPAAGQRTLFAVRTRAPISPHMGRADQPILRLQHVAALTACLGMQSFALALYEIVVICHAYTTSVASRYVYLRW